jgi:hypothetical protein
MASLRVVRSFAIALVAVTIAASAFGQTSPSDTGTPTQANEHVHAEERYRVGYSVSRLLITRTDSGGETFNFSEIVGNGAGAGISDLYYPQRERTRTKTGQKWANQVALDGFFNILKEFWPDIRHDILRQK